MNSCSLLGKAGCLGAVSMRLKTSVSIFARGFFLKGAFNKEITHLRGQGELFQHLALQNLFNRSITGAAWRFDDFIGFHNILDFSAA